MYCSEGLWPTEGIDNTTVKVCQAEEEAIVDISFLGKAGHHTVQTS